MKNIIPITELRNTVKIDELVNKVNEPVFVTKNGYSDLVIMSHEYYLNNFYQQKKKEQIIHTFKSEDRTPSFGFFRVKTVSIKVEPGNVDANLTSIISELETAFNEGAHLLQFQELTLTGSSIDDVIYMNPLFKKVDSAIKTIKKESKKFPLLIVFGAPLKITAQLRFLKEKFYQSLQKETLKLHLVK